MNHFNPSLPLFGDPYAQTSANANINNRTLYVGNLDKDIERQKLFDCFAAVVTKPDAIERVDLRKDFNGESKGYAFITFATHNDAQRAKTVLNHSKIKENSITISFMRKGKELDANANLFFRKLNKDMTSKELEELCAPYGPIVCAKLRFDSTGHSLGYGYVQFEKEQNANECMEALNGANVKESIIEVKKFTPASKRGTINQKCNVYVKDFPSKWNEKEVTDFIDKEFGKGGKVKITSKCVAKDQKLGKFYAFVAFETPDKAKEAIESLKEKEFPGEANRLYVDYAMTKEERRKKLREQHNNPKNETNLFIKSLAKDVTEDRLQKVFEKFGPVTSVCVKTHELNKANAQPGAEKKVLKFGFINFGTSADAAKALAGGKADQEVKSLIDPTHYKDVEFLYMHQPKSVRNQYIKMDLRNKKNLQAYEKQFNFFKQMLSQFNRGQPGQKGGFPGGNKKPFDMQGGRKPGMDAMNPFAAMGMNPMMMQQYQMNPQAMLQMQQMMFQQQHAMAAMQQQQHPGLLHGQMPFAQPIHQVPVAPQEKDVNWLKNNLNEFNRLPAEEQKIMLGNMMYKKVNELAPPSSLIPKITGMLIDLDVLEIKEIIEILENPELLKDRMNEAINIIDSDK